MQLADTAEQIQLNNRDRHLITELMPETEGRWVPGVEPGHATGKSKEGYSYEPSFELLIFIYPPLSIFNSISDTQSIFNSVLVYCISLFGGCDQSDLKIFKCYKTRLHK